MEKNDRPWQAIYPDLRGIVLEAERLSGHYVVIWGWSEDSKRRVYSMCEVDREGQPVTGGDYGYTKPYWSLVQAKYDRAKTMGDTRTCKELHLAQLLA